MRLSLEKVVFRKGYVSGWTEEIFKIFTLYPTVPVTYGVTDFFGEDIKGRFYDWEVQKVTPPSDDYYQVEKINKTRKRGGEVEYFVRWKSYPESMNSWTDDIRNH